MMRPRFFFCVVLATATAGIQTASADGFRNPPDTAAALAKSGSHIVWVNDASAVLFNPANLTGLSSAQVQLSALVGYSHADYSGQLGRTDTERPWCFLPAFALGAPLKGTDFALGLGLHVPFGRQTRWDSQGVFRYAAPVSTEMMVADLSPALAWRVSGLDLYYGTLKFKQLLPFSPGSRITADADGWAVGANAGVTWDMTDRQRLALTCRAPFDMTFKGDIDVRGAPPPAVSSSSLETTFDFPTIVALGYGLRLTESLRVEAKVEWLQHSRFKSMDIDAGANRPMVDMMGMSRMPQNWDDTWTFAIGPEWQFARDWTLRAGYVYLQSPIPDSSFAPIAMDVDQSMVSLGLGYQRGRHAVDLAYALGLFTTRRVRSNQNPLYRDATYEFDGHLAALSYTFSF
jgi:long-chain fatty acid transport protein